VQGVTLTVHRARGVPGCRRVLRVAVIYLTSSGLGASSTPGAFRSENLTDFGRAYIERLNELHVGLDLAHIDRKGFFDTAKADDKTQPLLVTHTGLVGVYEHWLNITDEQLRMVGRHGWHRGGNVARRVPREA
jgi:membrane dipeptidase